jgi:PAS domain-containing protein
MEKRLLQSEIQFKALFQFASEGILVANKEGEILIANPAVEELFGYDKGELDNKKIEILLPKNLPINIFNLEVSLMKIQNLDQWVLEEICLQ